VDDDLRVGPDFQSAVVRRHVHSFDGVNHSQNLSSVFRLGYNSRRLWIVDSWKVAVNCFLLAPHLGHKA